MKKKGPNNKYSTLHLPMKNMPFGGIRQYTKNMPLAIYLNRQQNHGMTNLKIPEM